MARNSSFLIGTLTQWNDERGFGFITAATGQRVFAHISAFPRSTRRPAVGDLVQFLSGVSPEGKARALTVRRAGQPVPRSHGKRRSWVGAILVPVSFAALLATLILAWDAPLWVAVVYVAFSLLCFAAYAADKVAAVSGGRRVSEQTLLTLWLLGGWPGALIAQQTLRHKTIKPGFRFLHWATVFVNIAAAIYVCSPAFPSFVSRLGQLAAG